MWLPEGDWFNFFTSEYYSGGWHTIYGDLSTIPVFAKAGAIVPLGPEVGWGGVTNPETLIVHIFAGADNQLILYEDDGETTEYQHGHSALTTFQQQWQDGTLIFMITPVIGDCAVIPSARTLQLVVHGIVKPDHITLTFNEETLIPSGKYDSLTETLTVTIETVRPTDRLFLRLATLQSSLLAKRDRRAETMHQLLRAFRLESRVKAQIDTDLLCLLEGEITLSRYNLSDAQRNALEESLALVMT
jgi:hypothetical protein